MQKKKIVKILGIGLAIALLASLLVVAVPASAQETVEETGPVAVMPSDGNTESFPVAQTFGIIAVVLISVAGLLVVFRGQIRARASPSTQSVEVSDSDSDVSGIAGQNSKIDEAGLTSVVSFMRHTSVAHHAPV